MRAFLGFEASSLGRYSHPIEIAWVLEDGRSESFLILPAETWTDWDAATEAIHGISREDLAERGTPADVVAKRLVGTIGAHDLFASEPYRACKWLGMLLHSAGLPRRAIRICDTEVALLELTAALLAPVTPSSEIHRATRKILADAAERFVGQKPPRRALQDAKLERARWLMVSNLAHAFVKPA